MTRYQRLFRLSAGEHFITQYVMMSAITITVNEAESRVMGRGAGGLRTEVIAAVIQS